MACKKIILFIILLPLLSCSREKETFTGHYYNSSTDNVLKSIEIDSGKNMCNVKLHYAETFREFTIEEWGEEIVLPLEEDVELHLYLNGSELRAYKVVENSYQPEDIEWTFYPPVR